MTDKEKLEKIKMLADEMYYRMQNLTTDTSGIRKAMYDYHQFIINEYYKEESVNIWHNMEELPIKGEVIVVQTKDTFYGLSVQKGGSTYKNRNKDRYIKWAYASDLLNLSNVQKTVKNGKELVSNNLKVALEDYAYQVAYDLSHDWLKENATWDDVETAVKLGALWQKQQLIDKACEWLQQHMKTLPELSNKDLTKHTLWKRDEIIDKFRQAMEE